VITDTIAVGGVKLRYRIQGQGDPVLLLHGWGCSIEVFDPVARALAPSFKAITIDFPGHGQSSLPPHAWHVSDFLDNTLQFMDALGLEKPHLVAHSFGGRVSIKMAAEQPHRAGRIVLTASAGVPTHASLKLSLRKGLGKLAGKLQSTARGIPGADPFVTKINRALLPKLASRDYNAAGPLRETLVHVINEDLTGWLPRIQSPVLLLWGANDTETPLASGETMASLIPNSELVVFPNAGHFPFVDEANKFNLHMLRFLRGAQ